MLSKLKNIDGKPILSKKSNNENINRKRSIDSDDDNEDEVEVRIKKSTEKKARQRVPEDESKKNHNGDEKRENHRREKRARLDSTLNQDVKLILPKPVNTNPASIPERKKFIERIAQVLVKKNPELKQPKAQAIEIEFEIAQKSTFRTYASTLRNAVYKLQHPEKFEKNKDAQPKTKEEELRLLRSMVIPVTKLEKYGFVMKIPPKEVNESLTRECRRCGTVFKLDQQLEPTTCIFHHGKLRRQPGTKIRFYDCCRAPEDDNKPCDESKHHVFQISKPEEKQAVLPYTLTKEIFQDKAQYNVLGIDCEMGFTTKGFELMRITAVDYFTEKTVLDTYVLPYGEVVDLNTRYSGISQINADFVSYNQALQELGAIMDKDTILIGHGLENDMNAMRLIHEQIIDTSILYPKFETSPTFRWSLKDLTFKYLSKNIQIGEHDSAEDSVAAIQIVKYHVKKGNSP